jgi:hypothetical protein
MRARHTPCGRSSGGSCTSARRHSDTGKTRTSTALFAIAFAQTLAYGLLLAREEAKCDIGFDAHKHINEIAHPLLRATLRALMLEEVRAELGPALAVLLDTVNAEDPKLLVPH